MAELGQLTLSFGVLCSISFVFGDHAAQGKCGMLFMCPTFCMKVKNGCYVCDCGMFAGYLKQASNEIEQVTSKQNMQTGSLVSSYSGGYHPKTGSGTLHQAQSGTGTSYHKTTTNSAYQAFRNQFVNNRPLGGNQYIGNRFLGSNQYLGNRPLLSNQYLDVRPSSSNQMGNQPVGQLMPGLSCPVMDRRCPSACWASDVYTGCIRCTCGAAPSVGSSSSTIVPTSSTAPVRLSATPFITSPTSTPLTTTTTEVRRTQRVELPVTAIPNNKDALFTDLPSNKDALVSEIPNVKDVMVPAIQNSRVDANNTNNANMVPNTVQSTVDPYQKITKTIVSTISTATGKPFTTGASRQPGNAFRSPPMKIPTRYPSTVVYRRATADVISPTGSVRLLVPTLPAMLKSLTSGNVKANDGQVLDSLQPMLTYSAETHETGDTSMSSSKIEDNGSLVNMGNKKSNSDNGDLQEQSGLLIGLSSLPGIAHAQTENQTGLLSNTESEGSRSQSTNRISMHNSIGFLGHSERG